LILPNGKVAKTELMPHSAQTNSSSRPTFILRMATATYAEMLKELQHTTQLKTECRIFILDSGLENLRTRFSRVVHALNYVPRLDEVRGSGGLVRLLLTTALE
jgi:hypothetical protein